MKNKKLIIALVAVVAVLGLMLGLYFGNQGKGSTEKKTFTLTVVHADGETITKEITSEEAYLAHALIAEGIINDEGIETGMYFTVDGETSSWEQNQSYWALYIDGEYATAGMNDTPIVEGSEYKLEYTIG